MGTKSKNVRLSQMNVGFIGLVEVGGTLCVVPTDLLVRHGKAMQLMNQVQAEFKAILSGSEKEEKP